MIIFSTKAHGYLDYLIGLVLLAIPTILQLDSDSTEGMILYTLGTTLLFYSACTNYELGLVKVIPMRMHLTLDIFSGIFLAGSPWVLGFEDRVCIPFVVLGITEIAIGLTTSKATASIEKVEQSIPQSKTTVAIKKSKMQNENAFGESIQPKVAVKKTTLKSKKTSDSPSKKNSKK